MKLRKTHLKRLLKVVITISIGCLPIAVFAASGGYDNFKEMFDSGKDTLNSAGGFLMTGSIVIGVGLSIFGLYKLFGYKENPQKSRNIGLAMLFGGVALVALPKIIAITSGSVAGESNTVDTRLSDFE